MNKQKALDDLRKRMQSADLPLKEGATNLVFGEGPVDPKVYFLGEAPGRFEDLSGRPFIGQAGKLLDKLLQSIGLSRDEVYITSVVRYRPPSNRDPSPSEIEAFKPFVDEEITLLNPKIIVTLGRFSLNKFLPDVKISEAHGKIYTIDWQGKKIKIIPMYHPAAAFRRTTIMDILKKDFLKIKEELNY